MIITLENWYIFGDDILGKIKDLVEIGFIREKLDVSWLNSMPYSICSIQEFEVMMKILSKYSISDVVEKKLRSSETKKWDYAGYFQNNFGKYYKDQRNIFEDEFWSKIRK